MPRWTDRRNRFRAVLAADRCVHPASVFDPVSARIAEDLGFEVGMLAGSVASLTVLGAPDLIVLTLTEFAEQAHRICRAGELPLLCDADHGYGNALSVMRTVEELETAGVAALSIEDTDLPQPFGTQGRARLTTIEEGAAKMRAALAARRDPALVIAGRTSAPALTGIADTIARAQAYEAAGVDAIFIVGLKARADLDVVSAAVELPLILGGAGPELLDPPYLAARGVRVCLQGHQPFMAAVRAVRDTLRALRAGTAPAALEGVADDDLMQRVMRNDDYVGWTKDWL
ncbi:MAG: isocitrate lyase/PEP mutase family protein [Betaproteobacteria bacterium]